MLIEFSVSNFRSVRERQTLSLVASADKELLDTNTAEGAEKLPRVVRSALIYGPNAAGKSNLLGAAQFAQQFVIGSAIQSQEGLKINTSPFAFSKDMATKPTEFEFLFVEDGVRFHYGFAVTNERVIKEWLVAYPLGKPQRWFEREFDHATKGYNWSLGSHFRGDKAQRKTWRDSTRANALFLSVAVQLNNEQLRPIFLWFQNKIAIVTATNQMNPGLTMEMLNDTERKHLLERFIQAADVGIEGLQTREENPPAGMVQLNINFAPGASAPVALPKFVRVLSLHKHLDSKELTPLDINDESEGTKKLFVLAGGWLKTLQEGNTLLVDELDRSLHPLMTKFLVGLFHDKSRNTKGAQLIFTTHDTTLLDSDLFRRDQIWFVEKDKSASTHLYPLLEYSPRKDENLEKGYLRGRYGAVPFLGEFRFTDGA